MPGSITPMSNNLIACSSLSKSPLGRYLVVFNPEGPRRGGLFDLPLEPTYYPSGSTRADAQTIQISSSDVHLSGIDLIAGRSVSFRSVSVHVQFEGGAPMKTAVVDCVSLPENPTDLPWTFRKVETRGEPVQFSAPVNRKLRIRVRDWHRRPLNAAYTATYEPGTSPITQDFVVKP
jgi:hypothetical protein